MKSDSELAYLAGVFDGEGSVSIKRSNGFKYDCGICRTSLTMSVGLTERYILEKFRDTIGVGSIKNRGLGTSGLSNQDIFYWSVSGRKCAKVIRGLFPYSSVKKDQMRVAIAFLNTLDGERNVSKEKALERLRLYERIVKLNNYRTAKVPDVELSDMDVVLSKKDVLIKVGDICGFEYEGRDKKGSTGNSIKGYRGLRSKQIESICRFFDFEEIPETRKKRMRKIAQKCGFEYNPQKGYRQLRTREVKLLKQRVQEAAAL